MCLFVQETCFIDLSFVLCLIYTLQQCGTSRLLHNLWRLFLHKLISYLLMVTGHPISRTSRRWSSRRWLPWKLVVDPLWSTSTWSRCLKGNGFGIRTMGAMSTHLTMLQFCKLLHIGPMSAPGAFWWSLIFKVLDWRMQMGRMCFAFVILLSTAPMWCGSHAPTLVKRVLSCFLTPTSAMMFANIWDWQLVQRDEQFLAHV